MFQYFTRLMDRLDSIEKHLDALEKRQHAANDVFSDIMAEDGKRKPFKLDDVAMQEGISNLMGYDPFCRKRGEDE